MTFYINPVEKLERFAELALTCPKIENKFIIYDASHPTCRKVAEKWLRDELTFLNKRDLADLKSIYYRVIEDGRAQKDFFDAIKTLQDKYSLVSYNNEKKYRI